MDLKAKKDRVVSACLAAVVFGISALLCRPVFYLNDDVTMRSILSGRYTGVADGHAVYMKYPLTAVLSGLYRLAANVPWMELFFAGCLLWVVVEVGTSKLKEKRIPWKVLCGILFVMPFFMYMHYTVIAAVLAGAAAFLLASGRKDLKPVFLWLIAWMIRSQVAYLALPFVGLAVLWSICAAEKNNLKKEAAAFGKVLGVSLIGLLVCVGMQSIAYADKDWKYYFEYNDVRTGLFDYTDFHSTDYYSETYTEYGMDSGEFYILDSYNTMLDSSVDAEKISQVLDKVQTRMASDRDEIAWIKECVKQYYYQIRYAENYYAFLWLLLFGLLAAGLLLGRDWIGLLWLVCLGGGRSLIWVYLIYKGRFPERVSLSLYIIEILLLLGMLMSLEERCNCKWNDLVSKIKGTKLGRQLCVGGQCLLLLAAVCILGLQISKDCLRVIEKNQVQQEWDVLQEYCEEHKEKLYLVDVFSSVRYSGVLWENDCSNMMLAGGWMSASPSAQKRFEERGAADGAEALYQDSETVFLADKSRNIEELQVYLTDRFGECSLEPAAEIICSDDRVFVEYQLIH